MKRLFIPSGSQQFCTVAVRQQTKESIVCNLIAWQAFIFCAAKTGSTQSSELLARKKVITMSLTMMLSEGLVPRSTDKPMSGQLNNRFKAV